ncbi:MAG: phospholipase D/transphosphatidylase [Paenibacillaceae bacterium]|nr:phospholipase D/transphosphatidylase [Paenibacillaceae bacterium]
MYWLLFFLCLYIFQTVILLIMEYRHPAKALAWLAILLVLPVAGLALYYFLARQYRHKRRIKRLPEGIWEGLRREMDGLSDLYRPGGEETLEIGKAPRLLGLLCNLPGAPITRGNTVEFYHEGKEFFPALLEAMDRAEDHIHMEYYIIRDDQIGRSFRDMMIKKAREGVEVRLLYDGLGSVGLPEGYLERLAEAGVETGCFLPPVVALLDKRLNYRNHRKITVIDGRTGFIGGFNIGDEYLGKDPKLGFWRDTHMQVDGDAAYRLQYTFLRDWFLAKGCLVDGARFFPEQEGKGRELVQIINSGPDSKWDAILELYFSAIAAGERRIWLATPYFIPEEGILLALKTAAVSGADVRIILPAVPDSRMVYWASLSYLEELLQVGVKVFLYQGGFIHAKVLIVDDKLATVGTANMDMRSFYSNFEQNAVLFDRHLVARLAGQFQLDLRKCREMQASEFEDRSGWVRAREMVARILAPLF